MLVLLIMVTLTNVCLTSGVALNDLAVCTIDLVSVFEFVRSELDSLMTSQVIS